MAGPIVWIAGAELLVMTAWFSATAVAGELSARWPGALDPGSLTTALQVGFVVGTALAATLGLADLIPLRLLFTASAVGTALANGLLAFAPGPQAALGARFLTGVFLAGSYPPAMKMVATWSRRWRGLAIGGLVGALTVGKAGPYLLRTLLGPEPRTILLTISGAALVGGVAIFLTYQDGPYPFPRRPFAWRRSLRVLAHPPTRWAIVGYLGHIWELYAVWTWLPIYLMTSAGRTERGPAVDLAAFGAIAAGGLGCVWGGWWGDRHGRERTIRLCLLWSGACCLIAGPLHGAPFWILVPLAWLWGFFVIADSAQFSALVTETAPQGSVGTALTLQTCMGFLLTTVTIEGVGALSTAVGWRWAFAPLVFGPLLGIVAARRLERLKAAPPASPGRVDLS